MGMTSWFNKTSIILGANEAIGKIPALTMQARSYFGPLANRAKSLSSQLSRGATGIKSKAWMGAAIGGASGAGYDYLSNDNSDTKSGIKAGLGGALLGAGAGVGYAYGRSGMAVARANGITASRAMSRARSGMSSMYGKANGSIGSRWRSAVATAQMRSRG